MVFGVMMPEPGGRRMVPARLALISDTFTAGGLFFDPTPWIWGAAGVIAVSVLWWLPFIHRMTRSLGRLTKATEQIADGKFDVDLGEQGGDEIGRLGTAVGQMAGKLDGFVTGQKRFLGDISHELCAPIARLQMAVGVLEMRADERQRDYVEDIKEEIQEMSGLVNELLSFSKAGLRSKELPLYHVELRPLIERVIERENTSGADVRMDVPETLAAMAEPGLLARAVGNLVRNAVRYAGTDGPITVVALETGEGVEIRVEDNGAGVPAEYLEKIFEPFFRIDPSRNRETGGTGLGMAIVRSCITSFGGTVGAENLEPKGFAVTITLKPAHPEQA
jgi:two-component system sensor histidine kinase CpxA